MIFGVSNHSPDKLISTLVSSGVVSSMSGLSVLPCGSHLAKGGIKQNHLLILTFKDLRRNLKVLNTKRYQNVSVYVFSSPLQLMRITEIVTLDFECKDETDCMSFTYHNLNLKMLRKNYKQVEHNVISIDYINKMIEVTCRDSLLVPLMTLIYRLSNAHQKVAKTVFTNTLRKCKDRKYLMEEARSGGLSKQARQALLMLYESHLCEPFKAAFVEYKQHKNAKQVCEAANIPEYEFQYLLNAGEKAK